jgi:SAM-dependent methyltransferase
MRLPSIHDQRLAAAFGNAAPEHFRWQTENPVLARTERALVRAAFQPLGSRILDLGCAEGATLVHLGSPPGAVGLDLFHQKLAFASRAVPGARFIAGSAIALPFRDASFDHVLIRDVVHHVDDPAALVAESRRVLAAGGVLDILEPNRNNPLVALHALAIPAERGELRSTEGRLRGLLEAHFTVVATTSHQALPLHRLVFHPELGCQRWAERWWLRAAVAALEFTAERLLPHRAWAYVHLRGRAR